MQEYDRFGAHHNRAPGQTIEEGMTSMKAVFCEKFGSHKDLVVREVEPPGPPAEGEITVEVSVRSIQFSDIVRIQGNYQDNREPPFVMGGDGVGIVSAVGEGSDLSEGDVVLTGAGCVEQVTVPASSVQVLPAGIDMAAASSFRAGYTTALHGLQLSRIQPGETLLVHGAAGGMGLAAVDIGKLMGARVIATASSDDKLAILSSNIAMVGLLYLVYIKRSFAISSENLFSASSAVSYT